MSIEIWKLRASLPWASSSGASSRLASQMMSGPRRWPGKWKRTPSKALAWQKAHQVRMLATAETLSGVNCGCGYEVSMVFFEGTEGRGGLDSKKCNRGLPSTVIDRRYRGERRKTVRGSGHDQQ